MRKINESFLCVKIVNLRHVLTNRKIVNVAFHQQDIVWLS